MLSQKRQPPSTPIDIVDWEPDVDFSPYPEGSRDKYVVFCPPKMDERFLIGGHRYLFKLSNKNYPAQFWAEIIAYRVGCLMGVPVPPAFAAINSERDECAALIEWFYGPNYETPVITPLLKQEASNPSVIGLMMENLGRQIFKAPAALTSFFSESGASDIAPQYVPGGNYMSRTIPNYELRKGKQHNVSTIMQIAAIFATRRHAVNAIEHWARVFVFDSVIGNTDRHHDNWGIVWEGRVPDVRAKFAPAFDNGTSLGHEILEARFERFSDEDYLKKYVERGTHHVKWSQKSDRRCQHQELLKLFRDRFPLVQEIMYDALSFSDDDLRDQIYELASFEISVPLTQPRAEFIIRLIKYRRDLAIETLKAV